MPSKSSRLRIMAGPNGSGKSTILKIVRGKFYSGPFINADEIEKSFSEKRLINPLSEYGLSISVNEFENYLNKEGKSWIEKAKQENNSITLKPNNNILVVDNTYSPYDSALAADFLRRQLLRTGETFTFETVLSHKSKIELLKESKSSGYKNYLYFICTVSPQINVERVKQRVQLGGHNVPKNRIVERYYNSLDLLSEIIPLCHRVYLFDNSTENKSIDPVAEIDKAGKLTIRTDQIPWWIQKYVIDKLYHR